MRLLYTTSDGNFRFTKDIIRAEEIPPYAILSHTWGDEEVVFDDVKTYDAQEIETDGWEKIRFCARQAKLDGLEYFWVDTCCIDKANNTELSEAINSMFRWYQKADKCYVYLPDVKGKSSAEESRPSSEWKAAFRKSRWFTRGWTLQELVAPGSVEFFSADGSRLGDKESLKQTIHEVTGIPIEVLSGSDISKFDVNERFSWAEKRQTTREEDGAYCLLGIVGCHLPLIYGEGKENALNRLRKEMQGREEKLSQIRSWLSAPDPSMNYLKAHKQRQAGTGVWLLQNEKFKKWKENAASRLWLYGIPGCGKTILSSTIVESLQHHCGDDQRKVTVYYYFDFNDAQKQVPELMLRSLLHQLLQRSVTIPKGVDALFLSCKDGTEQPSLPALLNVVPQVMRQFTHVYIVLDALDESERRAELMELLETVTEWQLDVSHVLMTSRKERDIEMSMENFVVEDNMICLQRDVVDEDISRFVQQRLHDDKRLAKWNKVPEVRQEIETALMRGAQGMFRWVTCQLDMIAECRNLAMLRKSLATLPKTLDQTYDRILTAISEEDRMYTIRILQWLTFSARPLSLEEVAEVAAIDIAREPAFNRDEVLMDPLEALKICSSLVTTVREERSWSSQHGRQNVILAHYSVQEYLVSERIRQGPAKQYSMKEIECHKAITIGCLGYLNRFQAPVTDEIFHASALADYSTEFWNIHLQKTGDGEEEMSRLAMSLLLMEKDVFANSFRLHHLALGRAREVYKDNFHDFKIPTPLYQTSFLGLETVTKLLVDQNVDVNAQTGGYGSALHAAVAESHLAVVEVLVNANADVNVKNSDGEYPIHRALCDGNKAIVKVLLGAGADVNTQHRGYPFQYPIQNASELGDETLVKLLIDAGADVNARQGVEDNALMQAVLRGFEKIAKLLIYAGADVNARGYVCSIVLVDAAVRGYTAVVELLLDKGAEINAQHHTWGSALQGAVSTSSEMVVEVLLRRGASVASDIMNRAVGSPGCTLALVRMLQQYNVPLDIVDLGNMTPLHHCVKFEHKAIAEHLIHAGVPIDARVRRQARSGRPGKPEDSQVETTWSVSAFVVTDFTDSTPMIFDHDLFLVPSIFNEHESIAEHLDYARIGQQAWSGGSGKPEDSQVETTLLVSASIATGLTPLHLAALKGKPMMTKFLLEHGADPNALSEHRETPLHLALRAMILGHKCGDYWDQVDSVEAHTRKETVRALLADPRTSPIAADNEGESPLHCAIQAVNVGAVRDLVRMGVSVFPTDGTGINTLHYAAQMRNSKIVVGLLESEQAKAAMLITSKDKHGRNVLHRMFWAEWDEVETVQWLLDHGAGGSELDNYGISPLAQYFKSSTGTLKPEICRLLLDIKETSSFVGHEGQTLGHFCAKKINFGGPILKVLNEGGVDLTKKDCRGRTVLHYAALYNTLTEEVLDYLLNVVGIKSDEQDDQGRTALQYAIEKADTYHNRDPWALKRLENSISMLFESQEREAPPLLVQPGSSDHLSNTSLPLVPNGDRMG